MNAARGSHFHKRAMAIILSANDYAIRFGFEQGFIRKKQMRFILTCDFLTARDVIVRHANQLHTVHTMQVRDVCFAMMMCKRENANFYHYASARGCNFTGWPVRAD